VTESGRW